MKESLLEAIIKGNEIRCPVCNKKYGELQGEEVIKGFRAFCKGKGKLTGSHYFLLNFNGKKEE